MLASHCFSNLVDDNVDNLRLQLTTVKLRLHF